MKLQTACFSLPQFPYRDGIFGGSALRFRAREDKGCHRMAILLDRLSTDNKAAGDGRCARGKSLRPTNCYTIVAQSVLFYAVKCITLPGKVAQNDGAWLPNGWKAHGKGLSERCAEEK
jgi:hypothetical protein